MAGKAGRSGRKGKAAEMGLSELLNLAWPVERRLAFFRQLTQMAEGGNLEAGKLLLGYTFGKAPETVNMKGDVTVKVVYGKGSAK
jgi:hypothetical protein